MPCHVLCAPARLCLCSIPPQAVRKECLTRHPSLKVRGQAQHGGVAMIGGLVFHRRYSFLKSSTTYLCFSPSSSSSSSSPPLPSSLRLSRSSSSIAESTCPFTHCVPFHTLLLDARPLPHLSLSAARSLSPLLKNVSACETYNSTAAHLSAVHVLHLPSEDAGEEDGRMG